MKPNTALRSRVLAATVLLMVALGLFHAWSLFVGSLQRELGVSRGVVSGIYALATASFTVSMLAAHRVLGRAGPAPVAAGAALLAALGLALASTGTPWAVWLGYGVLFGVANGVGYAFALQATALVLPERTGLAASISVTAYALAPAVLAPLLDDRLRTSGALDTFALLAGLTAAVAAAQLPLLAGVRLAPAPQAAEDARPSSGSGRTFWLLWGSFLLASAAGLLAFAHAAALVSAVGGTASASALAVSLIAAGNALGRLLGGSLSDALPLRLLLAAAGLASAAALAAAAALPDVGVTLVALALVGLGYGAVSSLLPAAGAAFFGAATLARTYGRLFTAWGAAGLAAPVLAGVLFDLTGGYRAALLVGAAAASGAVLTAVLLPGAPRER
jgi:MFS family permease